MKSIAEIIHHKNFPLTIRDSNGKQLYREFSSGGWYKQEVELDGTEIYYESSTGCVRDDRE